MNYPDEFNISKAMIPVEKKSIKVNQALTEMKNEHHFNIDINKGVTTQNNTQRISPLLINKEMIYILKVLKKDKSYLQYGLTNSSGFKFNLNLEGQLQFRLNKEYDENLRNNIKSAYQIWNEFPLLDRLLILDAFRTIFQENLAEFSAAERTVLFCQIFINEFVPLLTSQ